VSYDEITTKIEIPPTTKPASNIVHIDFTNVERRREPREKRSASKKASSASQTATPSWTQRLRELDLQAPWVIRLLAVVLILGLSMLVL
jgi:hypothetical protein